MALFAKQVPESDRTVVVCIGGKTNFFSAAHKGLMEFMACCSRLGQPGEIAFYIRQDHRNAGLGEAFSQDLQGYRLTGARGPGDQPVAVGIFETHLLRLSVAFATATNKNLVRHSLPLPANRRLQPAP